MFVTQEGRRSYFYWSLGLSGGSRYDVEKIHVGLTRRIYR